MPNVPVPKPLKKLEVVKPVLPVFGSATIKTLPVFDNDRVSAIWSIAFSTTDQNSELSILKGFSKGIAFNEAPKKDMVIAQDAMSRAASLSVVDAFIELQEFVAKNHPNIESVKVSLPQTKATASIREALGEKSKYYIPEKGASENSSFWKVSYDLHSEALIAAEAEALKFTLKNKMSAATDGSIHPSSNKAGSAFITEIGSHNASVMKAYDILHAELTAIANAMASIPSYQATVIYSDSKEALRLATTAATEGHASIRKDDNGYIYSLLCDIEKMSKEKNIELAWVKGHNGDLLNEAADTMALNASRRGRKLIDDSTFNSIRVNAVENFMSERYYN